MMALAEKLRPMFMSIDAKIPDRFRISLSLMKGKALGVCYDVTCSADHTYEILVKIDQADPLEVAAIVTHELIHASIGIDCKHGPEFKKVALALGLEGKMTHTRPGDRFRANIGPILEEMGPFPHARLDLDGKRVGPKKQTTRMHKAVCNECGYTVRVAAKWVAIGRPGCPVHGGMSVEVPNEEETPAS